MSHAPEEPAFDHTGPPGIEHGETLQGVVGHRTVSVVGLFHQHLRAHTLEDDHVAPAQITAVQADVVLTESCRE